MFIRGLRTKIAFNIAILFFVAMLLINVVTIMTARRDIIRKEASKGLSLKSISPGDMVKVFIAILAVLRGVAELGEQL